MIDPIRIARAEYLRRRRRRNDAIRFCGLILLGYFALVGVMKGLQWAL